jgi:cytochrome b561
MIKNTISSYGVVSRFFHWLIAILVICMLIFGFFLDDIPKAYQGIAYNTHKLTGLTILSLMLLRLFWMLTNVKPALPAGTKPWERIAEHVVHWSLYLTIICMPIAGWIGSVAAGHPPRLGETQLALPIDKNEALENTAFDVHNTLAFIIIALVTIHVLAALFHHFIKRDNVLRRMFS